MSENNNNEHASSPEFLQRGGEMGRRMREFDWTRTPLGSPAGWPQSLKTIVRMMLDSRFAMWMAWGPEGTFFCNDAYLPTVGLKRDWVLGARADKVWAEIWHDIGPRIAHVLSTGEATWDEGLQLFLQRSGYPEETFHTFSYSPVHDDASHVAGMLCVVVENTDRLIGERRLRLLSEIAAVQSRDAPSLVRAGEALLQVLDRDRRDVAFAALYLAEPGATRARLAACTSVEVRERMPAEMALDECLVSELERQYGPLPGAWPEPVQQALAVPLGGSAQAQAFGVLLLGVSTRRQLDERYRDFLRLVAGQVASRLADAQAQLEERHRAETLAELDRAKNLFFSNVSHEFRTPLTLMLGPLEELLDDPARPLPPEAGRTLALIHRNGLRLRKLVNTLLDFARLEAGRVQARYQPVELGALTAELASAFRSAVEQAGLVLDVECAPLDQPVFVDPEMWEKIVLNLLSNAFKFTFAGGIGVRLQRRGDAAELVVSDTGPGIAAEQLPLLFDRFHRVANTPARSQEGTGIGLALVRELVQMHGGTIRVESTPGQGSRFIVALPLGRAHLPADATVADAAPQIDASASRANWASFVDDGLRGGVGEAVLPAVALAQDKRPQVLIADDNADMRSYLQGLLSPRWSVRVARDGQEAWEMLQREPRPQLLLTDVMMPRMDGEQLLRRIRADEATRMLPVLMLSARAGDEARIEGLNLGADDYLVKPFSARELVARVEVLLVRVRMREERDALDRRLADVFRYAPVGLALLRGPQFRFEFANAAYRRMVQSRDVVGKTLLEALPELAGQEIERVLAGVYASGEPYIGRAFATLLRDGEDGELREHFFDFVYQPLRAETEDEPPGIVVICFEVTDMVRARQAAEQANRAKEDFIAMLGHELRNPLAPITTALQLMRMQHGEVAARERGIIERQVQHMVRLVDDLLDVARVSRGNVELKKVAIEASEIVTRALETVGPLLERKRQQVLVEVPASGLPVRGDPTRLTQVLANLLTNAAKFSEPGQAIEIRALAGAGELVMGVRDHGVGMSDKELATVFEPFVQGRQAIHRPDGGLGLGLTIARSLALLHGGSLSARSEGWGRGSTFELRLPLDLQEPAAAGAGAVLAAPAPAAGGLSLLLVDDNDDAATTLAELLEMLGHRVKTAPDGPRALELLAREPFDAAILDIGLPVMDGYELAQCIRRQPRGEALRLIALTGFGQPTDTDRSSRLGFAHHLVKPVDIDALERALADGRDRR
ncbi:ATP-binding protein [Paucibacter sp. R3-3]|uniref:histidine kinase n=1 Tax=Roseateles agri TaxID=3098619 RepID=A0ABU5DDX4_9BURK|nr:ATP-binding protein [Paucibacter sp. R3-3]MDY0743337.1 ATP-binding protein [Paucibacter sp. R3-3]